MRAFAILFLLSVLQTIKAHVFQIQSTLVTDNSISNGATIYLLSSSTNLYLNKAFIPEATADSPENALECFYVNTWGLAWKLNASYDRQTGEFQLKGCSTGLWLVAVNGGGSNVTIKSKVASGWEAFIFERVGSDTILMRKDKNYLRLVGGVFRADTPDVSLAERFIVKKLVERLEPNIYGVNLGGWLVPEKWMVPNLYSPSNTTHQYAMCEKLGTEGCKTVLENHYSSFIKPEIDLPIIKAKGINLVRIPVGYWATQNEIDSFPHPNNSLAYLDKAIQICDQLDLAVFIDLHGVKDSQNGWDHSGWARDRQYWTDDWPQNMIRTIDSLVFLVSRYKNNKSVLGIELLNEPHYDLPLDKLRDFYAQAYAAIRVVSKEIIVIMSDSFRWYGLEADTFIPKTSRNTPRIMVDIHYYQCFSDADKNLTTVEHLARVSEWQNIIKVISKNYLFVVGEWSLGLDGKTFAGMTQDQIKAFKKLYFQSQKDAFDAGDGSVFWSWRIAYQNSAWSLEQLYNDGYFS